MSDRKDAIKKKINGGSNLVLLPPPQRDYSHTLILALATIVSALIVAKKV